MGGIAGLPRLLLPLPPLLLLLLLLADEDSKRDVSMLMCSQPGLLLPAYEAAVRSLATLRIDAIATVVLTAGAAADAPTAAASFLEQVFGSGAGQQQHQGQLYALQVSCAKCGLAAAGKRGAVAALGSVVATSSKVLMHIVTQCASSLDASASSSSSSGSGSSTAAATALQQVAAPWVALLARCLAALAGMMEAGEPTCQPDSAHMQWRKSCPAWWR
jgi:hypothetical protein